MLNTIENTRRVIDSTRTQGVCNLVGLIKTNTNLFLYLSIMIPLANIIDYLLCTRYHRHKNIEDIQKSIVFYRICLYLLRSSIEEVVLI